jgi:hypothetical protein
MAESDATTPRLFLVVGPLRTGSSLMARCLDDHPQAVCLCESEVNRALFQDYYLRLHCRRMEAHGFTLEDAILFINKKKQDDIESFLKWFPAVWPRAAELYHKPDALVFGDKSPDFFRSQELVDHLAEHVRLIYTVRDPRAIFWSIESQTDTNRRDKDERWDFLLRNYEAWRTHLDRPNIHAVRYEDLVSDPIATMTAVYAHLGLPHSTRFLEPFPRAYPQRFLWTTAVDWQTGIRKDFDASRVSQWRQRLSREQVERISADARIAEFMDRFGYDRDA